MSKPFAVLVCVAWSVLVTSAAMASSGDHALRRTNQVGEPLPSRTHDHSATTLSKFSWLHASRGLVGRRAFGDRHRRLEPPGVVLVRSWLAQGKRTISRHPQERKGWFRWSYLLDWGLSAAAAGAAYGINKIDPPIRPWRRDDPSISLPYHEDTISEPLAGALAGGVPLLAFVVSQIWLRDWHDLHHATLGLAEAMSFTLLLTTVLKVTVGRLRPDFQARCQPAPATGNPGDRASDLGVWQCTGDPEKVSKGRRSFPSGHSSIAFAGGAYLAFYLAGKLRPFDGNGALWKLPLILSPLVGASLIAVSRSIDNRHHWEDIVVGALLGTGVAYLAYRLNYPALGSTNDGKPHRRHTLAILPSLSPTHLGLALQGTLR